MTGRVRLLGAVLAGGQSRRFGSDKAMALFQGRPLIENVMSTLSQQVDDIAIIGRNIPGHHCLPDRPEAGLGPLGGLCAALHHAAANGYAAVVSTGCDTLLLPSDLVDRLMPAAPSHVSENCLVGCWPSALSGALDEHLARTGDRSMRGWAHAIAAGTVRLPLPIANVNTPRDLDLLKHDGVRQ